MLVKFITGTQTGGICLLSLALSSFFRTGERFDRSRWNCSTTLLKMSSWWTSQTDTSVCCSCYSCCWANVRDYLPDIFSVDAYQTRKRYSTKKLPLCNALCWNLKASFLIGREISHYSGRSWWQFCIGCKCRPIDWFLASSLNGRSRRP